MISQEINEPEISDFTNDSLFLLKKINSEICYKKTDYISFYYNDLEIDLFHINPLSGIYVYKAKWLNMDSQFIKDSENKLKSIFNQLPDIFKSTDESFKSKYNIKRYVELNVNKKDLKYIVIFSAKSKKEFKFNYSLFGEETVTSPNFRVEFYLDGTFSIKMHSGIGESSYEDLVTFFIYKQFSKQIKREFGEELDKKRVAELVLMMFI